MMQKVRFKDLENYGLGPNIIRRTKICSTCGQVAKSGSFFCQACDQKLTLTKNGEHTISLNDADVRSII